MSGSTDELIRELTRGVRPVGPIPRLRTAAIAIAVAWLVTVAAWVLLSGGSPRSLLSEAPWGDAAFAGIFAGLALAAAGGVVCSLSGAVPGRDLAERLGGVAAVLGIGLAAVSALLTDAGGDLSPLVALELHLGCIRRATALGLVAVLVAVLYVASGHSRRPLAAVAFGLVGCVSLGALVTHLGCRLESALHMLFGHALAPVFAALVLAFPATWLVRRRSRSR